jgi:hypothetical protein
MEFDVFFAIWDFAVRLFENPIVRVISYVVSPILAILAFIWNRKDIPSLVVGAPWARPESTLLLRPNHSGPLLERARL